LNSASGKRVKLFVGEQDCYPALHFLCEARVSSHLYAGLEALGILAEASLMLRPGVMGVNVQRWKEQASAMPSLGGWPGDR
jgi:hypothetical protein